jgi:hypothetical protein
MKYILPIILVAFLACLTISFTNIFKSDHPSFRYHVDISTSSDYNKKCWETVKQKLNVEIENGHIQEHF